MHSNFFSPIEDTFSHSAQVSTLELEKELLENELANCVTYLQALRKKQTRNERRLAADSSLPVRKRKKIRQSMRELEKEIQNRERDKQAFLNNLQACKANIYLAETVSSPSTTVSSTIPDLASDSTLCSYPEEPEARDGQWNGWADKTASSPFQKDCSNSSSVDDIAPDDHPGVDGFDLATTKSTVCAQYVAQTGATWPLPMACTSKQFVFSPEAALFEPRNSHKDQDLQLDQQFAELHLSSPIAAATMDGTGWGNGMDKCSLTKSVTAQPNRKNSFERSVEEARRQSWDNRAPRQQRLDEEIGNAGRPKRSRVNSV
ncbi:hypothetical protein COCCADRAFT_9284 [Bipolaris zeicola 26-R-13]|uniref:Uncharacterized protein n=1 Tax=Cochliobolus carbonum (strain 26-R-13) TaxID=930089 RepID=W6XSN9_COCC2|nr:uncharacterized protein COCCADRAFT_9284 [Bipolaris zeicola 26-R-13]EUC28325.1 hypothetical protein COCCADRAFT_9284 [Bipolaris zeicola 26-R-13]